jgi:hypothetical protein
MENNVMSKSIITTLLIIVGLSSYAAAQNCKFNVNGDWDLRQNNGILVKISLTQKGDSVTGLASYQGMKQGHSHTETGDISGTFHPSEAAGAYRLQLNIKWDYGETGVYTGWVGKRYIQPSGRSDGKWWIKGDAFILQDPNNFARMTAWQFVKNLPCLK